MTDWSELTDAERQCRKHTMRQRKIGEATRKEIRRMSAKGRDAGTIAVWMHLPVSVVNSVLNP
jgi:hypothetical protein